MLSLVAAAYASRLQAAEIHFALDGLLESGHVISDKLSDAAFSLAQQSDYFSKPTIDAVWGLVAIGLFISDRSISDERAIYIWTTLVSHMSSPNLAGQVSLREMLQTLVRLSIGRIMAKQPQFMSVLLAIPFNISRKFSQIFISSLSFVTTFLGDPALTTALQVGVSKSTADWSPRTLAVSGLSIIRCLDLLAQAEYEPSVTFNNDTVHGIWADAFLSLTYARPSLPSFNGEFSSSKGTRLMGIALTLLIGLAFVMSKCHDCIDLSNAELLSFSSTQLRSLQKEIFRLIEYTRTAYFQLGADPHLSIGVASFRFAVAELVFAVVDASDRECKGCLKGPNAHLLSDRQSDLAW